MNTVVLLTFNQNEMCRERNLGRNRSNRADHFKIFGHDSEKFRPLEFPFPGDDWFCGIDCTVSCFPGTIRVFSPKKFFVTKHLTLKCPPSIDTFASYLPCVRTKLILVF